MLSKSFAVLATFLAGATSLSGAAAQSFPAGVIATGTNGPTNPPAPTLGTAINQTSDARLLTVNSISDFCLFAPPTPQKIGDSETIEVAWCTQQRNNARLIPDGTITGVSFLKTDFYVQVIGYGDFTKLNIPYGDYGGELDPHGAYGSGNPIGGNVTSNITGSDQRFQEWMLYVDYNQFCLRVCTNANSTYDAEHMCWHELDEVGCNFVMPGNYNVNGTFETCDADVAYPPGWYPTATVSGTTQFSTFAQRYTGTLSNGQVYTIGDLTTPTGAFTTPKSSNCVTTATIANGVAYSALGLSGVGPTQASSGSKGATGAPAATGKSGSSGTSGSSSSQSSSAARRAAQGDAGLESVLVAFWAAIAGVGAILLLA